MSTFYYVEDYLEFIAGYRDENNKKLGMFGYRPCPVSLARYDVKIVDSLAIQTSELSRGYTDKQALLAVKIVSKYRKQLSQLKVPVLVPDETELDNFRFPIRQIDRSKRAYIENQRIVLRFPYDSELINVIKAQGRDGQGSVKFDHDQKVWILGLTENAINWLCTIAENRQIEVDQEIQELYQKILDVESRGFAIKLVDTGTGYDIENASDSLKEYINDKLGGFGYDNLLSLIDNSEILGYEVADEILQKFLSGSTTELNTAQIMCTVKRLYHFPKDSTSLLDIVEYARSTNRLPVYVYATGIPKTSTDEIKYLRSENANTPIRCMVSESSLMVGSRKTSWLLNAEKIFYIE